MQSDGAEQGDGKQATQRAFGTEQPGKQTQSGGTSE